MVLETKGVVLETLEARSFRGSKELQRSRPGLPWDTEGLSKNGTVGRKVPGGDCWLRDWAREGREERTTTGVHCLRCLKGSWRLAMA